MKKRVLYIILAALVLAVSVLTISAIADAGNFSGGSDYGGGGGWSGGGGSYSGGGGSYFFVGGGDDGGGGSALVILGVIVMLGLFVLFNIISRNKRSGGAVSVGGSYTPPLSLMPLSSLKELDPNFSEAEMQDKISNLYVRMQKAWQDKNFEPMRPYMTDALYNQFAIQLDELKRANRTNYVEHIAVLNVALDGWSQGEASDALVATVSTRIVDYTLDDASGKLVGGSKTAEKFMTYRWTLVRSKGMKTPERAGEGRDGAVRISCPSCGASVEINQSAKCEYCGSIISAKDYDWSISAVQGLAQRTGNN